MIKRISLLLSYTIVFTTILSCHHDGVGKNEYNIRSKGDQVELFIGDKKVDVVKIKSKYFQTYMPATWDARVRNDTVFLAIDTSDNQNDNLSITYTQTFDCTTEGMIRKKESVISSSSKYEMLQSVKSIVPVKSIDVRLHEMELKAADDIYKQRCYYLCDNRDFGLTCCLTTSSSDFENKVEVVEMAFGSLVQNMRE